MSNSNGLRRVGFVDQPVDFFSLRFQPHFHLERVRMVHDTDTVAPFGVESRVAAFGAEHRTCSWRHNAKQAFGKPGHGRSRRTPTAEKIRILCKSLSRDQVRLMRRISQIVVKLRRVPDWCGPPIREAARSSFLFSRSLRHNFELTFEPEAGH